MTSGSDGAPESDVPEPAAISRRAAELAHDLEQVDTAGWGVGETGDHGLVGLDDPAEPAQAADPSGEPAHFCRSEVTAALAAAERLEELRAFVDVDGAGAMAQAEELDLRIARGGSPGSLAGMTVGVKDIFDVGGRPTRGGSTAFPPRLPISDSPLVGALRAADAIPLGKTNMHELGWGLSEEVGSVRNPHDLGRIAGGSSGGSAAAVAAGVTRLAIGTDGGGSVRMPAAFCGVVGYKPTPGFLPGGVGLSTGWSLAVPGVLARDVADVRATARATGRPRPRSAGTVPARPTLVVATGFLEDLEPEVESRLEGALDRLGTALGPLPVRTIDEVEAWRSAWLVTFASEFVAATTDWLGARSGLSPDVRDVLALGDALSAASYLRAQQVRSRVRGAIDEALGEGDVLLTPAVDHLAPAGELAPDDPRYYSGMRWLAPCNLSGHPAVSLPVPGPGLPVGLQLIGRRHADIELLAVAERVEQLLAT